MISIYQEGPDWKERLLTASFMFLADVKVIQMTDAGWLCTRGDDTFLLDPSLLPDMMKSVEWVLRTEEMTDRIEEVGTYRAVDFNLRQLLFGDYLTAENYYQAFLQTKEKDTLRSLFKVLYQVPEGEDMEVEDYVLMGAFLWFGAVKRVLAEWFPKFFKPSASSEGTTVTMETMAESTNAQIRLLTKGDVTKYDYVLNKTYTWTALSELNALAKEAEEIKQKFKT